MEVYICAEFYTIVFMLLCVMDYSYAELFILTVYCPAFLNASAQNN